MRLKLLAGCLVLLIAGVLSAAPRRDTVVDKTARNDGDTRAGLTVTCTSTAWTAVVATRATRRKVYLINISGSGGPICIGTATMEAGLACANGTHGIELGTSAAFEDSNEGALTCRSRTGAGVAVLKGFDEYDSAD